MKIQKISEIQFKQILAFNKQIFPQRSDAAAHFRFLFVDNPLVADKSKPCGLVAINENNEIFGQFLLSPAEYNYRQEIKLCYFGCDYYVAQAYRTGGTGALLAMQAINGYKPYFTIGPSPEALQISLALKTRCIGNLHKYIRFKNVLIPFKAVQHLHKPVSVAFQHKPVLFPDSVQSKGVVFKKLAGADDWREVRPSDNHLEFSRSRQFMEWRFFSQPDKYSVYQTDQFNSYLVCRVMDWHGLRLLALVDYRTSLTDSRQFTALLDSAFRIATGAGLDGMLTMSSLAFFDTRLQKKGFIKIGRPQAILTNAALDLPLEKMTKRNLLITTMADCDMDLNM
ncbi:MAG TPA: hypothetical protein PLP19_15685 [bacterium]|nr:hypothetical protein [bacterium]HPN44933.1 hypothetical protein [bacterium]